MASKEARFVRAEMKENGFLTVNSKERTYKRVKPAQCSPETLGSVMQESESGIILRVARNEDGVVSVWKKDKPLRAYYWSGTKLRLLTIEESFRLGLERVDGQQ